MITEEDFKKICDLKGELHVLRLVSKGGCDHYISTASHRVGKSHEDILDSIDDVFEALVSARIKKLQKELDKYIKENK